MRRDPIDDPAEVDRPVLPWRLVAGALLHVAVPGYLLFLAAAAVLAWPVERPLALAGRATAIFCSGFAALLLAASVLAAVLDPPLRRRRARRSAGDPAAAVRRAEAALARALRRAAAIGGVPMAGAAARVRDARWDHRDERCRAIAADLARAADSFATAHASAAPERRDALAALAADAFARVAAAVEELADGRARLDAGDALTHARYLAQRYGPAPDLAGPVDD